MSSELNVNGVGNLGSDPSMKYTPEGTAITAFSLAFNKGKGQNKKTVWVRAVAFGKLAEICNEYLKKGSKVYVAGVINSDGDTGNPRVYQKKDQTWASALEIELRDVTFLERAEGQASKPRDEEAF